MDSSEHGRFASSARGVFDIDSQSPGRVAVGDMMRCGGFVPAVPMIGAGYRVAFRRREQCLISGWARIIRLLASAAARTNNVRRSAPLGRQRFMPRPRISTEMRPSVPAQKRWPCLNAADLFVGLALRRLAAVPLRNAYGFDGALHARRCIMLTEEAAISAAEFRRSEESATVALKRRCHMSLVRRVSLEHLIPGDQTFGAQSPLRSVRAAMPNAIPQAGQIGTNRNLLLWASKRHEEIGHLVGKGSRLAARGELWV